jgi:hypothetical protein
VGLYPGARKPCWSKNVTFRANEAQRVFAIEDWNQAPSEMERRQMKFTPIEWPL